MSDANEIEENFDTFFRHRFKDVHYFSTRAEIVDAVGKQSLDEFCSMIRNEAALMWAGARPRSWISPAA